MKKFVCVAMAVCMVLSLVACGGSSSAAASSTAASTAASGSTAAASTGSGETIKVGILANTSGDYAVYGNAVQNGVML